ncbi:MAG: hypothetical protein AB8G18_03930 [Gammaproteobacteria bacterium]
MWRTILFFALFVFLAMPGASSAQTMTFSTSDTDYVVTNVFSNVGVFNFNIEIDAPLAAGAYDNPTIVSVDYQVQGALTAGTPSGFSNFDLMRSMTGDEFYAQGSSLSFEISQSAVLTDGVQVAELVGGAVVFTFNGRENDNGRFHPALFELRADGTGRIQNSDNIVTQAPFLQVNFGAEYNNDLMFDAGNTTLLTASAAPPPDPVVVDNGGGSGGLSLWVVFTLLVYCLRQRVLVSRVQKLPLKS